MALSTEVNASLVKSFGKNEKDSGSTAVQVALLTAQIEALMIHLEANKKDNHSRRGLLIKVGKRRSLLNYLDKSNHAQYLELIKTLKLRK